VRRAPSASPSRAPHHTNANATAAAIIESHLLWYYWLVLLVAAAACFGPYFVWCIRAAKRWWNPAPKPMMLMPIRMQQPPTEFDAEFEDVPLDEPEPKVEPIPEPDAVARRRKQDLMEEYKFKTGERSVLSGYDPDDLFPLVKKRKERKRAAAAAAAAARAAPAGDPDEPRVVVVGSAEQVGEGGENRAVIPER
jgi:hypothetical protein